MSADLEFILSQIRARRRDPNFMHEVATTPRGRGILVCIQCGRCSSGCPVARFTTAYNPRRLMEMITLGLRWEVLFQQSWHCLSCFTCLDRCPQGGDVGEIILGVRNIAAREGNIPKGVAAQAKSLYETGHLVNATATVAKQREKLGLPSLPPETDVQKILDKTGFRKLVGIK